MTPEERREALERDREKIRRFVQRMGLYAFFALVWPIVEPGVPFVGGPHIELICAHLEAVSRGECRNLIINIPPGMSKSTLVSVVYPVWHWLRYVCGDRFMFATFDETLSTRDSEKSRNLVNSTWFRILFGDLCGHRPGSCKHPRVIHAKHDKSRDRADTHGVWYNAGGGLRFSTTVRSKATGWHCHIQIIDDPLKPHDVLGGSGADTRNALNQVTTWFSGTMATRKADPKRFARVVVMQRLHDGDLCGFLEKTQKGEWVILSLPMEYDPERHCKTPFGEDWRKVKGELLCPERFDATAVEQLKRDMGPILYSAQCQQQPVPPSGGVISDDWIEWHDYTPEELEQMGCMGVQSWDCTFKSLATSDYVAGHLIYYNPSDDCYYLADVVNDHLSFVQTLAAIENWNTRYPGVGSRLIENKANGTAVLNALQNTVVGLIGVDPGNASKESRVIACTPVFAAKRFKLRRGMAWSERVRLELTRFPRYTSDDNVDAIAQALGWFLQNGSAAWLRYFGQMYSFTQTHN